MRESAFAAFHAERDREALLGRDVGRLVARRLRSGGLEVAPAAAVDMLVRACGQLRIRLLRSGDHLAFAPVWVLRGLVRSGERCARCGSPLPAGPVSCQGCR